VHGTPHLVTGRSRCGNAENILKTAEADCRVVAQRKSRLSDGVGALGPVAHEIQTLRQALVVVTKQQGVAAIGEQAPVQRRVLDDQGAAGVETIRGALVQAIAGVTHAEDGETGFQKSEGRLHAVRRRFATEHRHRVGRRILRHRVGPDQHRKPRSDVQYSLPAPDLGHLVHDLKTKIEFGLGQSCSAALKRVGKMAIERSIEVAPRPIGRLFDRFGQAGSQALQFSRTRTTSLSFPYLFQRRST